MFWLNVRPKKRFAAPEKLILPPGADSFPPVPVCYATGTLHVFFLRISKVALFQKLGLLNESHPRIFQTITLSFFIAFKARQG